MADIVIAGLLLLAVGNAAAYIIRQKKKGAKCIGCPAAGHCQSGKCGHSECGK